MKKPHQKTFPLGVLVLDLKMGNFICKRENPPRIIFQGIEASGKTSLMYLLALGELVTMGPTMSFNLENFELSGIQISGWDIGGRGSPRTLFSHYYTGADGVVYVIDSKNTENLDEAFDELDRQILNNEDTFGTVCMILANKQDLTGALSCEEIERRWRERKSEGLNHVMMFKPCSVTKREGIAEAFTEFVEQLKITMYKRDQDALHEAEQNHEMSLKLLMNRPVGFLKALLMY